MISPYQEIHYVKNLPCHLKISRNGSILFFEFRKVLTSAFSKNY